VLGSGGDGQLSRPACALTDHANQQPVGEMMTLEVRKALKSGFFEAFQQLAQLKTAERAIYSVAKNV
jgi:hypothetical protein